MKINSITIKGLSIESDGTKITTEEVGTIFNEAKNGGTIIYKGVNYTILNFAELLCALNKKNEETNKDLDDNTLARVYEKYESELQQIENQRSSLVEELVATFEKQKTENRNPYGKSSINYCLSELWRKHDKWS